jgi:hypothetical protein
MSTTLTIPAGVLPDVREGLLCLMGDATGALRHALEQRTREHHPERFAAGRRQLEQVFALLDLVGWGAAGESHEVDVDLGEYGPTLKEALDGYLPILEDQEKEADVNDKRRAEEGKAPRREEVVNRLVGLREFVALVARRLPEG